MIDSYFKVNKNRFYVENYVDMDTGKNYDLLIYEYYMDDIKSHLVVGSIAGDVCQLIEYFDKISNFWISNTSSLFIFDTINNAYKNDIFKNINFSYESYNLFVNCFSNEDFMEKLTNHLREIIIDQTTRRFSATYTTDEVFNSISFYDMLEEKKKNSLEQNKVLKKVI